MLTKVVIQMTLCGKSFSEQLLTARWARYPIGQPHDGVAMHALNHKMLRLQALVCLKSI
jgi:hypothetical protein